MSRVRRYSRSGPTAQHSRSPTGLSPSAVTRSSGLRLKNAAAARRLPPPPAHSSNPPRASPAGCAARGVWAPPRSLAATEGILSSPRGTEMFQFPRCPPGIATRCPAVRRAGCPIRRPPDLRLPAPPRGISPRGRVLRRPPTPRHPPCAHHAEALIRLRRAPIAGWSPRRAGPARASRDVARKAPSRPSRLVPHRMQPPAHDPDRSRPVTSRPRRAVPSRPPQRATGRRTSPAARCCHTGSRSPWCVSSHVCVFRFVQCARATQHEPPHPPPSPVRSGTRSPRSPHGGRGLPRPQNLTGSAWRIVKVQAEALPDFRRSSNLCRDP
jgi:hypothetical protein